MPTPDAGPFALLRDLIREIAAQSPAQFKELLAALDIGSAGSMQRAIDVALMTIREMEDAGPERWSALLEKLVAWASGNDALETRLKPIVDAFASLVANLAIADVGPQLEAMVMPLLGKLSEACVSALMGEPV